MRTSRRKTPRGTTWDYQMHTSVTHLPNTMTQVRSFETGPSLHLIWDPTTRVTSIHPNQSWQDRAALSAMTTCP
ncbi:hypothetical protein THIARS_70425 [Thiomonas delicata]|uniref:Uncharacterized protein n=1 Tax=Thiomonas delicata TaxID=364030 RepID=A0A238D6E3_THIDL|nr:hypothetical protein THIARS_70425 [Thiomonas delicata]